MATKKKAVRKVIKKKKVHARKVIRTKGSRQEGLLACLLGVLGLLACGVPGWLSRLRQEGDKKKGPGAGQRACLLACLLAV